MNRLPDDLTLLKVGIKPVATGGRWTDDTAAAWIIRDLEKSGILPAAAAENRLAFTSCPKRIAELLNRRSPLPGGSSLVISYFDAAGNDVHYCRLKPERPRMERRDGEDRPVKYDAPAGCPARLYIPPAAAPGVRDPKAELILSEGEKN